MKKRKVLYLLPLLGLLLGGCDFQFDPDNPVGSLKEFFSTQIWQPAKAFVKENILGIKEEAKEEEKPAEEQQGGREQQGEGEGGGEQGGEETQVTVSSIAVKENSVKTSFQVGDEFTVEGGKLVVSYSDNSSKEINMTLVMIPVKPNMNQAGNNIEVGVSYLEKTTSYFINIAELPVIPTVAEIAVKTLPKVDYFVGDEFTVEGGVLQVTMSDSTRKSVDMTLEMIDNAPDMSVAHENYEVLVSYEGAHTSYYVNVALADTREDVSIGISYEYNMGPVTEITDFTEELVFVEGKEYKFHYGAYPSAAADSLGRKYLTRDGVELDEKPTEIGEYIYKVELSEGDELYKPAIQTVNYKIIAPIVKEFLLNSSNGAELTSEAGEATQNIEGITVNYKNAKAADGALATLVKQVAAGERADLDDNYIEIASPVAITNALTVDFPALINNYVRVYGSYDGVNFFLLDTLTRAKQTTTRANGYFYFRFVNSTMGETELKINSISFSYEEGGAPDSIVARAELSDSLNGATYAEAGAFWPTDEEVFDENYSSKSIKYRNVEMHAYVDFGFEVKGYELGNYKLTFKAKPSEDATYQASASDPTVKDNCSVYGRLISNGTKLGANKKLNTMSVGSSESQWETVEMNLAEMYDEGESVNGVNLWINRKCTTGFIYVDDFRLVQSSGYPRYATPSKISVSGVTKLEFTAGDTFEFDGEVTALFSDGFEEVIANDDPNLTITAPDMSSAGTKEVVISYTYEGVTRSYKYSVTVNPPAGVDPKDLEDKTIVSEVNDLAKTANFLKESSTAAVADETENVYGRESTNAIKVSGLTGEDKGFFIVLPEALPKAHNIKVRFFMKANSYKFYMRLSDANYTTKSAVNVKFNNTSSPCFDTQEDAGNDWMLFEHTFDVTKLYNADLGVGRIHFRISSSYMDAEGFMILDGIEIAVVD